MAKTLLRSGNLDDFQSVGGGGQAVFTSALQIRETLRLKSLQALVECLAIPQVNDSGDRVDWYAPLPGNVVTWKSADNHQRQRALRQLEKLADSAMTLSRKCQQSEKTAQRLFGALLEKALQFPGENHVFLVNEKPVLTFWGFVNLNEHTREDPFACLQTHTFAPLVQHYQPLTEEEPTPEDDPIDEPLVVLTTSSQPEVEITARESQEHSDVSEPEAVKPASERPARRLPLWTIPALTLLVAAAAGPQIWRYVSSLHLASPVARVEVTSAPAASSALPVLHAGLPLQLATVTEPAKPQKEATAEPQPVTLSAIPKDALVMDADQMRAGTTAFLNGSWRIALDVKDAATGKAPSLRYQIKNNKGSARLVHGDNVVCKADIFSGLHKNGELLIKSRGLARCSDGSRYPMPQITCIAGTNDVAECSGRYGEQTVVSLTFRKAGNR